MKLMCWQWQILLLTLLKPLVNKINLFIVVKKEGARVIRKNVENYFSNLLIFSANEQMK